MLLPERVERGERVLPPPNDERPHTIASTPVTASGTEEPKAATHVTPLTPDAGAAMRAGRAWRAQSDAGRGAPARGADAPPARDTARSGRRSASPSGRRRPAR